MNFFERELRNMFEDSDMIEEAKFCGRTMLAKLDDELLLKLQFVTQGRADHYTAIEARIINRTEGEVDRQAFNFADIIGMKTGYVGKQEPYIWDDKVSVDWYMPVTEKEKARIAQTVLEYAGMYQEQGMTQVM